MATNGDNREPGDIDDLFDGIREGDTVWPLASPDRDSEGEYEYLDIFVIHSDGEEDTYRLEGDVLSQEMLDYIFEWMDYYFDDVEVNPGYGFGEQ